MKAWCAGLLVRVGQPSSYPALVQLCIAPAARSGCKLVLLSCEEMRAARAPMQNCDLVCDTHFKQYASG